MARGRWLTTEFAFVAGACGIVAMGWVADLFGTLSPTGIGHHGGDNSFFRLSVTFFALGLASIGVGYEHHERFFREPTWALSYIAGYLVFLDGILHGFAFNDHLGESFPMVFFAVFAASEVALGLAIPHLPRRFDLVWLAILVFLIAAYVLTRAMPVWPINAIEEPDALGVVSKLLEIVAVVVLVRLIRHERRERQRLRNAVEAARGASRS